MVPRVVLESLRAGGSGEKDADLAEGEMLRENATSSLQMSKKLTALVTTWKAFSNKSSETFSSKSGELGVKPEV